MNCQECHQRPATLHFTKIINGEKTEVHLCEQCAQEKGDMFTLDGGSGFSVHHLLAGILNGQHSFANASNQPLSSQKEVHCDRCGMTYHQFSKLGKFGCSHCYESFQESLPPLLKRLHSGNVSHTGKIPARVGGTIQTRKQLHELKSKLKDLISHEEFEQAAEVRDQIRSIENQLETEDSEGGTK